MQEVTQVCLFSSINAQQSHVVYHINADIPKDILLRACNSCRDDDSLMQKIKLLIAR